MFFDKKKISLLSKLPRIKASYTFPKWKVPLPVNITISLLYSCNSRCMTCNVYEKKVKNLTVEEYDKTFASIGKAPFWFTMSGGEPFLRKDIVDICKVAYKRTQPAIINIPTNGSLSNIVAERAEKIITSCPKTDIIINLSLDAIGEEHDKIRGFPGNWDRAMITYSALKELTKYPNFTVGIHTVISKFNVVKFPEIYNELIKLNPDSYITEIAEERVELGTIGQDITPDIDDYSRAIDFLVKEIKDRKLFGLANIARSFRIEYYNLVKTYLQSREQVIPCHAGIASCQISPDGNIWPCCVRADSMGNLRENDYNFKRIWNGQNGSRIRKSIKDRECACPLANASYTNLLVNPKSLFRIAKNYL